MEHSPTLLDHLKTHRVDGATVDSILFEGGRILYPGRKRIEQQLGFADPYTIEMEARTIEGLLRSVAASISFLAREATETFRGFNPTLDLLWGSHNAYPRTFRNETSVEGPSLDRLIAALVMVEHARTVGSSDSNVDHAVLVLVRGMTALGFPPNERSLEEIWGGAPPACVGLNIVEIG